MKFPGPKTVFGRTFITLLAAGVVIQVVIVAMVKGPSEPPLSPTLIIRHLNRYLEYVANDLNRDPSLERIDRALRGSGFSVEARGADSWKGPPWEPPAFARIIPERVSPPHDGTGHLLFEIPIRSSRGETVVTFRGPLVPRTPNPVNDLSVLLGIVVTVFVGASLALRSILRPIRVLSSAFDRVKAGTTDVSVAAERDDELGRLSRSFNEMAASVHFMIKDKEQLFTELSHEFRAPIARAIAANSLVEDPELRAEIQKDMAELDSLIHALLTAARLEAGSSAISFETLGAGEVVESVRVLFPESQHRIRVEPLDKALSFRADRRSMGMLLRNLVENGLKYSDSDRVVRVSAAVHGANISFTVQDEGNGISEEEVAHIFAPFFRGTDGKKISQPGFGLGLSLCRRIARAHGGDLEVASRPGKGTSVTTWFPLTPADSHLQLSRKAA